MENIILILISIAMLLMITSIGVDLIINIKYYKQIRKEWKLHERKNKTLKRVENKVKILGNELRFNEVHLKSYENKQGKIRYNVYLRVSEYDYSFTDMTLNDVDSLLTGILIGYLFCRVKNEYKK